MIACFCLLFFVPSNAELNYASIPMYQTWMNEKLRNQGPPTTEIVTPPPWVMEMKYKINEMISSKGFEGAQSDIRKLIDDTDDKINGEQSEDLHLPDEYMTPNLGVDINDKPPEDPKWMAELKLLVKDVVRTQGRDKLETEMGSYIKLLEETESVKITSVDVTSDGTVYIQWRPWSYMPQDQGKQPGNPREPGGAGMRPRMGPGMQGHRRPKVQGPGDIQPLTQNLAMEEDNYYE